MKSKWILGLAVVAALAYWKFSRNQGRMGPGGMHRPPAIPDSALDAKTLKEVGASYQKDVQPLLMRACFDCHSSKTVYPWYHNVPGVAQYLDHHVEEAKSRLDLSDGFPFAGKSPIISRVRGIGGSVKRGSMPLWDYKLMHPDSRLSEEEKKVIVDWSESSFERLSQTAKPYTPVEMPPHT
jgi:hypothetical protein